MVLYWGKQGGPWASGPVVSDLRPTWAQEGRWPSVLHPGRPAGVCSEQDLIFDGGLQAPVCHDPEHGEFQASARGVAAGRPLRNQGPVRG